MKKDNSESLMVSRRVFLKKFGGVALFVGVSGIFPTLVSCSDTQKIREQLEKHSVTAWVQITEDGEIIIYNPASEMGQGSMTSLPVIFAEEMDADWSKVQVEFSPQEPEIYGSDAWGPDNKRMITVGSRTTSGYYPIMRKAGAQARHILLNSAANHWQMPISELSTAAGIVLHERTDKKISYGELVPYLVIPETLPDFTEKELKQPKEFRLIGKEIPRKEIPEKVNGKAQFAIDIRFPNMVYGVLERGKLHGSRPKLLNEDEILKLDGILKIVQFDYAIGIVANKLERALNAKKALKIAWSESDASGFNSQEIYEDYVRIAEQTKKGEVVSEIGNVEQAMQTASKTYMADYKNDYVYHAQMEPLNAIVQITDDLKKADVWVGSQQGFDAKLGVPALLEVPPENVNIHLQYLGGGFGRRSTDDFVVECAVLAKAMAPVPVKLLWTREDDLTYGMFRPLSLQRIKASVDEKGNITGFTHIVVGDGDRLITGGSSNDHYDIPNQIVERRGASHGIRLKHWRSVGHGPNKFAIESMLDEIANDQGVDPVALRRRLMVNSPRALATLDKVVEMSNWNETNIDGRAKGISFVERSGSLGSGVCEISLDRKTGKITVHRFWIALDAGTIVQPDNVKAQLEGGIIMGISSVLKERITVVDGEVQQSNFHDYALLRMEDIPDSIETTFIKSTNPPQGIGESSTPLVAGAVANAFLALTGKPLRHLPFTPERVLEALAS